MKDKAIVIWIYCLILFVGGFMGYIKTGSLISLISAAALAGMLARYGYALWEGNILGYRMTIFFLVFILAFFAYRLAMTHKMMPAGVMTILTFATLLYIWVKKSEFKKIEK